MSPPSWASSVTVFAYAWTNASQLSLLDRDIRKLPTPVKRQRRKADSTTDSLLTSPLDVSTSTTASMTDGQSSSHAFQAGESSTTSVPDMEEPPALHAFRKKSRRPYAEYPPAIQAQAPPEQQRYWSEYDHPESEEDEGYYIYIDPNAKMGFPGQELLENWVRKMKKLLGVRNTDEEARPLSSPDYGSSDDEMASESRTPMSQGYGAIEPQAYRKNSSREGYLSSIFGSRRDPHCDAAIRRQSERERQSLLNEISAGEHERELTKLRFYATCLASAVTIDILLSIMTATSRRKERGVVDFTILFGTICSLILLVVAVWSMRTRCERLGWMHQGSVMVIGVGVITADVLLFRWVLNP
jgi:hypothetical protein